MKISSCENPRYVVNPYTRQSMLVPCRVCNSCRLAQGEEVVQRLQSEFMQWNYGAFFTLTYSDSNLPQLLPIGGKILVHSLDLNDSSNKYFEYDFSSDRFCQNRILNFGFIPVLSSRDVSMFLSSFRKNFKGMFGHDEYQWFIIGEYGSSSYRPHYHGALFFNDPAIAESSTLSRPLYDCLCKSWISYGCVSYRSTSVQLGHIDLQGISRDKGYAFRYIAQYLNCFTDLPQVLREKVVAPFRRLPHKSTLGASSLSFTTLQDLFFRGTPFYVKMLSNGKQSVVLLPHTYRSSVFRQHRGFDLLDSWSYFAWCHAVSSLSQDDFVSFFVVGCCVSDIYKNTLLSTLPLLIEDDIDPKSDLYIDRIKRLYYSFKQVVSVCLKYGVLPFDYGYYYNQYRSKLALFNLRKFYELQCDLVERPLFDIRFLNCLYMYDDSVSSRLAVPCDNPQFYSDFNNCPEFRQDKSLSLRLVLDSTKTKKRNSFVSNQNLLNF